MKVRQIVVIPIELLAFSVLILRAILRWIFSIPSWIIRGLDALYYKTIQLRRSIVGEPAWKVIDYINLGIYPPNGWPSITDEDRATLKAAGFTFFKPEMAPLHFHGTVDQPPPEDPAP